MMALSSKANALEKALQQMDSICQQSATSLQHNYSLTNAPLTVKAKTSVTHPQEGQAANHW